ncbi:MAG: VCBS repeat-containing protein [Deltaproteobacteria bacterium]|nr:VCBS repeat-containing protein [Deltaproteobacteria bacterium]MBK8715661.1 VCBS repeat-containing protein [Deltaproteobacteria bacterium]MBP7287261.1 VCBS repeat-containing protein [Nannocystaceae bacterium]
MTCAAPSPSTPSFLQHRRDAARTVRRAALWLGALACGGCFDPSHTEQSGGTDGSGSTSSGTATTASTTATTTASTTTASATGTVDDSSATMSSMTMGDSTDTASDSSSSGGEVSDCPGGAPTVGDAPYQVNMLLAGHDANDVDVGDIDGDGHLDLVVLSRAGGAVETFFGDGTGVIASDGITPLQMNGFPDTVRLAAIADDTLDLFVHMEGPVELWVVRGDGAGNWPTPQVFDFTYVRAIDIADLNGDDVRDLAYVGASDLEIRLGQPTETFGTASHYGTNTGSAVRAADVTGDGVPDVVTADYGSTELLVYGGVGDGTFTALPTIVTGSAISGADVGLLDDDELLDLVLTTSDDLRIFYGEAAGGISTTPGTVIDDALTRVRVADIDDDGDDDLLTRDGNAIEIRFSNGDTTFSDPVAFACPMPVFSMVAGDFNEDCVPDLVAPMGSDQSLCLLMSDRG